MKRNIGERRFFRAEVPLDEPHFDEEATLLSARPVVPLHEVKAKARLSNRLSLGLVILSAILVGAISAVLIYRERVMPTSAVVESNTPVFEQSQGAGGQLGDSDARLDLPVVQHDNAALGQTEQPDNRSGAQPRQAPTVVQKRSESSNADQNHEDDSVVRSDEYDSVARSDAEWQIRRAERREARRRERRKAREVWKESRGKTQPQDDLTRIREIFEGSPRP
jgi:hypothetical protein